MNFLSFSFTERERENLPKERECIIIEEIKATPHNSSAALAESFASILQFEKLEIHTVSLRFSNFNLSQNLSAIALASLRGAA